MASTIRIQKQNLKLEIHTIMSHSHLQSELLLMLDHGSCVKKTHATPHRHQEVPLHPKLEKTIAKQNS